MLDLVTSIGKSMTMFMQNRDQQAERRRWEREQRKAEEYLSQATDRVHLESLEREYWNRQKSFWK